MSPDFCPLSVMYAFSDIKTVLCEETNYLKIISLPIIKINVLLFFLFHCSYLCSQMFQNGQFFLCFPVCSFRRCYALAGRSKVAALQVTEDSMQAADGGLKALFSRYQLIGLYDGI